MLTFTHIIPRADGTAIGGASNPVYDTVVVLPCSNDGSDSGRVDIYLAASRNRGPTSRRKCVMSEPERYRGRVFIGESPSGL
jgi:hypothetical protein